MTALVFNCHYNGLSIIQELGRRKIFVIALDSTRSIGTYSRYACFNRSPDPQVAENDFIEHLMQLGHKFDDKPVLFPTNDHWAVAISRHKETLTKYYTPCVADYTTIELIIEKQRFYEWALAENIMVPRSWRSDKADEIPDEAFPLAAKPEFRRTASNDKDSNKHGQMMDKMRLTIIRKREDLAKFLIQQKKLLPHLIFQEYIEGLSDCMYTVGVYADRNFEVKGLFTGRKVRGFPPDIGDCIVGQIEDVPDKIKQTVKNICKKICFHGIAEFEFKKNAVTGQFKLIEINPRSWSWIGITPACGVSLPWMAYADLTGIESVSYIESNLPTGSIKYVKFFDDLQNCLYRNRQSGYKSWDMTVLQWLKSLKAEKIVYAEFSKDDPLIGMRACNLFIKSISASIYKRLVYYE